MNLPNTDRSAMPRRPVSCYRLGPFVFVPDYANPGVYHGPDGLKYSAATLERVHAWRITELLWPREWLK